MKTKNTDTFMRHVTFLTSISVSVLMTLGTVSISPSTGWAQSDSLSLTLNADATSDFWQLTAEAERIIASRITEIFTSDPTRIGVIIEVSAERNGTVVPLMTTQVMRENWQREPQVTRWTQYFANAQVLLSYISSSSTDASSLPTPSASEFDSQQRQIQLEDALD